MELVVHYHRIYGLAVAQKVQKQDLDLFAPDTHNKKKLYYMTVGSIATRDALHGEKPKSRLDLLTALSETLDLGKEDIIELKESFKLP